MAKDFLHYYVQRAKIYRDEAQRAITCTTLDEYERAEIIKKTLLRSVTAELANLSTEISAYYELLEAIQTYSQKQPELVLELTYIRTACQKFIDSYV